MSTQATLEEFCTPGESDGSAQLSLGSFAGGGEIERKTVPPHKNPRWLHRKHWEEKLEIPDIAVEAGVDESTINQWMKDLGVSRRTDHTRQDCLDSIQRVADKLGRTPSRAEYKEHKLESEPTFFPIQQRFGTWNKAKEVAGVGILVRDNWSEDRCIESIRRAAMLVDGNLTREAYQDVSDVSDPGFDAIRASCGSWNTAKKKAGLDVLWTKWATDECITVLHRIKEIVGEDVSSEDYRSHKRPEDPCLTTLKKKFGGWSSAKTAAGLTPDLSTENYTEEDCLDALLRVADELGRSPNTREYMRLRDEQEPSKSVIWEIFPSWNSAKQAAGLELFQDGDGIHYPYGSTWSSTAAEIRGRDGYQCISCGMSSDVHQEAFGRDLDVHHIHKLRSFFEDFDDDQLDGIESGDVTEELQKDIEERIARANDPTNLVTLCRTCHRDIENSPVESQVEELGIDPPRVSPGYVE